MSRHREKLLQRQVIELWLLFFPPSVRREEASQVSSNQPLNKPQERERETAISLLHYQSHSSGIIIPNVLHPSAVREEPLTARIYMEHIWKQTGSLDQERISHQKSTVSGDLFKLFPEMMGSKGQFILQNEAQC